MKLRSPLLVMSLLVMLAFAAFAQSGPNLSTTIYNGGSDYCQNPSIAKSSVVVNLTSATTTEMVASATGKKVYLCSLQVSIAGTPTILFKTGTKVTNPCDTGATSLSGTYAPVAGMMKLDATGGVLLTGASGGELCITSGGTVTGVEGVLTYVQR